ncbi:methylglyoxal synthase [Phreatobacter cathodiphilus]|uniref:Methylglyoxal synthase n=1 Tax=Phreatobacter cathodiphilus TaxID=1868589 RepID=A0A2S0NHC9_9HYPH|nr:methylglyoxal synthase [Phreatobacter cathodiphilus]AVO47331.1 methylglyoxal synthase [Phreatobacter cathodiphilus]
MTDDTRPLIALIAHDKKKPDMLAWARSHHDRLVRRRLVATGTTGSLLKADMPDLDIALMKSGPLGGDQQIGALIVEGRIDLLVFLVDPLSPHPHDVDVKALTRLAVVYDVPMACNLATADRLITLV